MRKITLANDFEQNRTTWGQARASFYKSCRLKNLAEDTFRYYEFVLDNFHKETNVEYVNDICQETIDDFIFKELEKSMKITTINNRLRGIRAFVNFCISQKYLEPIKVKLMKEDQEIKEPYSDEELYRLLKKPKSANWTDYRSWAAINYMIGTGNRLRTVINLKVSDIDFDNMTITMQKVKNRRKQIIPLSPALKDVLQYYLSSWKWSFDDYLFPASNGNKISVSGFEQAISNYNHSRGVEKTSCHLFRHTFAKNYIMNGGGMAQLQTLLGHSTMEMTRHYIALYGSDLQKDYEKLNPLDNLLKEQV